MKKTKLIFGLMCVASLGVVALTGCNKKPNPTPVDPDPVDPKPTEVTITMSQEALTVTRKDTAKLSATTSDNSAVTFSVDNFNVKLSKEAAASGEEITLTAMNVGQSTITATSGEKSATCIVTVQADGVHTLKQYLSVSPSNWNELTYRDANDTEILTPTSGSFFTFNYAFDEQGNIIDGGYQVQMSGVTDLEDVTTDFAGNEKYSVPADADSGYAYKLQLRDDLKWDDGTPIHAEDFVYTMTALLDPLFKNYRADTVYKGTTVIHNAQNYLKQGQSGIFASRSVFAGVYSEDLDSQLKFDAFLGDEEQGAECSYIFDWFKGINGSDFDSYFAQGAFGVFAIPLLYGASGIDAATAKAASAALDGKTMAEIKADAALKAYWDLLIGWWQTEPGEELDFFTTFYTFPEVKADELGIMVGANENELVVVLDKVLNLLKDDGSLSYHCAYDFSSLPLVKKDLYETCKHEPALEGGLWTSDYNSSVEKSASWGPYKLTEFQAGKQFVMERNTNWYGYNMAEYAGQYETDRIVTDIIAEWNTAWLGFRSGDYSTIGIDVSIAADYRGSSRAIFTPDGYVGSLQLQSSAEGLKGRESEGVDKEMLLYQDFRQALSLAIDRSAYTTACTTASLPGLGLFNSMHYYDVENGGVYRNTDVAKRVICEVYGVNVDSYDSLDEAYAAATGYNLSLAREKLIAAYNAALEAGTISETDKVVLTYGTSVDNEATRRTFNWYKNAFETLAVGTPLEGRLTLDFVEKGDEWAESFRDGAYDLCGGGWQGAEWNPGYLLGAYVLEDNRYARAWDADHEIIVYNPYGDGDEEHEYHMSIVEWYNCLNGVEGCFEDWSSGEVDEEFRLGIIAEMEKCILKTYYVVPTAYWFTAGLLSYQIEYGSRTYNTFMGYGGIRYMTYNYNDAEWAAYLAEHTLDYRN